MPRGSAATSRPVSDTSEMNVDTITLSAAGLGRVFGISERRVRELRDQGSIPGQPDGRYNLVAAGRAYYASCRPATGRAAAGGVAGLVNFDAARIRLLTEQADAQAMRNATKRGELIDME